MKAEALCIQGQELLKSDVAAAAACFAEAARLEPKLAVASVGEGVALSRLGRIADAVVAFARAADVVSSGEVGRQALSMLGLHLELCGRQSEALAAYRRLVAVAPHERETLSHVAVLAGLVGDGDAAIEALEKLAALSPRSSAAQANLGVAYARYGRHSQAVEAFKRAEVIDAGFFARRKAEREEYERAVSRCA